MLKDKTRPKLKLKDAYYMQNFSVGPFLYKTYGLAAYIQEGQTREEVMKELALHVNEQFLEDNPHLAGQSEQFQPPEPAILPIAQVEKPIGKSMVEQIMSCDSMKVLESYRLLVKNNDEWKAAYDVRFEQLKQIEIQSIMDRTEALIPQPQTIKLKTIANAKNIITNGK
jgi:hypothetical protein